MTAMHRPLHLRGLLLVALATWFTACGSANGDGPGGVDAPSGLTYTLVQGLYRVGEPIAPNLATVEGTLLVFTVEPALPAGLVLDPDTGAITGTPGAEAPNAAYVVTASNAAGFESTQLMIDVGPALPAAFASLPLGFVAETLHTGPAVKIGKLAIAPDGRIFFAEVATGVVGLLSAAEPPVATVFGSLPVIQAGGHQGLIGLVLDPDFANNGHVYVQACVPGDGMTTQDRQTVVRFTDVGGTAMNATTIVDDMPISVSGPGGINCGGELLFDATDMLLVSIGDVEEPAQAQQPFPAWGGKIHRIDPGDPPGTMPSIPADNPDPASPEYVRGIRNCFGLALHDSGGLFGADNGPMADDELNLIQAGKNYLWENAMVPPIDVGPNLRNYADVITPTALCWHDGQGWGAVYDDDLFMTSYSDHALRRFQMSGIGPIPVDIDSETVWATFVDDNDQHRPLDVCVHPVTGDLYVSTFTGIYRIRPQ